MLAQIKMPLLDRSTNLKGAVAFTLANTFALTAMSLIATNTIETFFAPLIVRDGGKLSGWAKMMTVGVILLLVAFIIVLATGVDWKESILGMAPASAAAATTTDAETTLPGL